MEGPLQGSEKVLRFEQPLKFIKSLPRCFYKHGGCSAHFWMRNLSPEIHDGL